jgi:hypothetical protein
MVRPEPDGGGTGTIKVTPQDVAAAAGTFANAQTDLSNAWETLQSALDSNAGMAGDDQPANEFNAKYGPAVAAVWRGFRAACLKLGGISMGLTQTANNFVRAEHHSTVGNKGAAPAFPAEPVFDDIVMADPSSPIGPGGGSWLPGPLKKFWPDADTGKLRAAAKAWYAAAQSIDGTSWEAQGAIDSIATGDDTAQAITEFWSRTFAPGNQRTLLAGLEQVCRSLGDACDKYAQAVDDAHSKMKEALAGTGIAVGITTILGILGTPFTFGASDAAAAEADTAEAAGILGPMLSGLIVTVSSMVGAVLPDEIIAMLSLGIEEAPDIEVVEAETTEIEGALDDELASAEGDSPGNFADTYEGGPNSASSRGIAYENYLQERLGGEESFSTGGRQFDGKLPSDGSNPETWFEAKSGNYWDLATKDGSVLAKFKSSAGQQLQIAQQNGAKFMVVSENPIPQSIIDWLTTKGIPYIIVP